MTEHTSDVVVVGSGHNALISAAYLARAGLSVTVLEAREVLGGSTVTEELTLPGFRHDTAATGHMVLQLNPLLADDELGLLAGGLRYVAPDPVAVVHETGRDEPAVLWLDAERTAAQLEGYAAGDGEAYLQLLTDWREIADVHVGRLGGAPGTVPDPSPEAAARWAELAAPSAWDVVHERFRDDRSRLLLLWLAGMTTQPLDRPGTGLFPIWLPAVLGTCSWTNAIGGSQALIDALAGVVHEGGGRAVTGQRVTRIVVEHGRAVAVETEDGERYAATKAVVASAHAQQLPRLLAGETTLPPEFDRLEQWRNGNSMFVVHAALPSIPEYALAGGRQPAVLAGVGTLEGIRQHCVDMAGGRLSHHGRWTLGAVSSAIDPTRAPDGQATLKVLTGAPHALDGDPANWTEEVAADYARELVADYAAIALGYEPGDELAAVVHTPVDLERRNLSAVGGGHQGGEMTPDQMGPNRPVPGWSGYRMPVDGLYLTGASTHPGGAVNGFSGRNAAAVVLEDVGIDPGSVMSAGRVRIKA